MDSTNTPQSRPVYPEPFVVPPSSGSHKQTFILLHGGGLDSREFGQKLLETSIPEYCSLPDAYPDAKFIFPTATEQFSAGLGVMNRQFFDLGSAENLDEKDYVQIDGLHDSVILVHGLLRSAIREVGRQNVVLGGLSQGCAVSLTSLLLWEESPFAAVFGMAEWLPFRKRIEDSWAATTAEEPIDASFKRAQSISCLREVLDLPAQSGIQHHSCVDIPVFIGHGVADDALLLCLAEPTHQLLPAVGLRVHLKYYENLGHWYSGEMLRDFINFLTTNGGPLM